MRQNLRNTLRCTALGLAVAAALVFLPANAQAQAHTTGFDIAKDCPIDPVDQGDTATCTFTLTNNDLDHGVENLVVTNEFPFPGGTVTPGVCLQGGVAVTTLGAAGTATDTCAGSFDEVAPITCEDTDTVILQDEIRATGTDCGPQCGVDDPPSDPFEGLPVSGSTTNVIRVNPIQCPTAPECQVAQCTPGEGCSNVPAADSTPCGTDENTEDCSTPGCFGGQCVQTHVTAPDSTPCGPDSDGLECTLPGCQAGQCVQTHVDNCIVDEICRTPGFWGTHADAGEKEGAPDVTGGVLDAYNAANQGDPLTICGTDITNADAGNANSALEAICVAVKGDSRRQLARQLMAAALNCIISSSSGDPETECPPDPGLAGGVCEGVSIEAIFDACNAACPTGVVAEDVDLDNDPNTDPIDINCIEAIDCFNNGFVVDPSTGECTGEPSGCHENDLVNGCFDFQPPGPAGSPKACNEARKNDIDIVPDLP